MHPYEDILCKLKQVINYVKQNNPRAFAVRDR